MNTGTPLTGLKHAHFLVSLYLSYMGHEWAQHEWHLYRKKKKKKVTTESKYFVLLCTFSLVGYRRMASQLWS